MPAKPVSLSQLRPSYQSPPKQAQPPAQETSTRLEKARLFCLDDKSLDFEFMFNPSQVDVKLGVKTKEDGGARTALGQPKVSFEYPENRSLTLSKIVFYTYEEGESVLIKYINKLQRSTEFVKISTENNPRPPLYIFIWGNQQYIRCFIKSLQCKLTMFLPNGTPVRAEVNLTLTEVDETVGAANPRSYQPDKFGMRDNRTQPPKPIPLKLNKASQYEQDAKDLRARAARLRQQAQDQRKAAGDWWRRGAPLIRQAEQAEKEAAEAEQQAATKDLEAQRLRDFFK